MGRQVNYQCLERDRGRFFLIHLLFLVDLVVNEFDDRVGVSRTAFSAPLWEGFESSMNVLALLSLRWIPAFILQHRGCRPARIYSCGLPKVKWHAGENSVSIDVVPMPS